MNDLKPCYLDANDLVYSKDPTNGITSAGFNVNSIMMKMGISPITTINTERRDDCLDVADLFKNQLVVPNWALAYHNNLFSGGSKAKKFNDEDVELDDDEDDVVDDDLHDRLLDLVKEHDLRKVKPVKKRLTRKPRNIKNKTRKMK